MRVELRHAVRWQGHGPLEFVHLLLRLLSVGVEGELAADCRRRICASGAHILSGGRVVREARIDAHFVHFALRGCGRRVKAESRLAAGRALSSTYPLKAAAEEIESAAMRRIVPSPSVGSALFAGA